MYTVSEIYRLKRMAGMVESKHRIIDVGFAHQPNPFLANAQIIGVDVEQAPLPENYQDAFYGTLAQWHEAGHAPAEALVAGEIIEHVEQPIDFLRDCFRVIAPGGLLVLSTPNPNSFIERLLTLTLSRRFFYSQDHLMLFPQRWLIRMLETANFRDVQLYSGGFPVPMFGLVPFPRSWCYQTIATATRD
mgnify:CR=1 FL=1